MTRRGFSLIELLAAIGIIAILAAILVPIVSGIVARSHQATCSSNMRQIYSAIQLYGNEHNNLILPSLGGGESGAGYVVWTDALLGYLSMDEDYSTRCVGHRPEGVLACPAEGEAVCYSGGQSDYAKNEYINSNYNSSSPKWYFNSLTKPSQTICLIDAKNPTNGRCMRAVSHWSGLDNMGIAFRHDGLANAVFFDGHVESLRPDEVRMGNGNENYRPWSPQPLD